MKKSIRFISLFFFVSTLFLCCREDCDDPTNLLCPNYDPCASVFPADASFVVLDSITPTWADTSIGFICDTFGTGSTIYFKALNKKIGTTYEWKVGTDARTWTEPEFNLIFSDFEGSVTVRLVTTALDNHSCLEDSELQDTSYQTFDVLPNELPYGAIFGKFKGTDTLNPDEEYELTVLKEGQDYHHSYRLFGLPIPCDYPIGLKIGTGHDWFVSMHVYSDNPCRNAVIIGRLQENNNNILHVDYYYNDDDGNRLHYVFEGERM